MVKGLGALENQVMTVLWEVPDALSVHDLVDRVSREQRTPAYTHHPDGRDASLVKGLGSAGEDRPTVPLSPQPLPRRSDHRFAA
ncbi:hypothetical protein GCM10011610_27170 [Nocardia rhizosphaerihabitans]|uniref:Uncharacterized protein n=1 Tax=Nocardia rhizosphaerihabitans TaxID=1691570 RepID=A0ABQ2KE53_9NOCA|nr:hypothetical protein GCM10011610_27170 [Nocardia rhizosphaerihabitans]